MNRIDRLSSMILRLQARRFVSIDEFVDEYDISERTVFRDIKALGEAGVPVGFEKDRGYYIVEGYNVPPIMFTKEEASAILVAGKLLERQGDKSLVQDFDKAQEKVRAVLKTMQHDFVDELEKHIEVVAPPSTAEMYPDKFLLEMKNALVAKKVLAFDYYSNYSDTQSHREVEPLGLCHYANHWHLIAHCRKRDDVRDFRADRISKLTSLDETFDPELRPDFKQHIFGLHTNQDLEEVQVLFAHKVARMIGDQKYFNGLIDQEKTEVGVLMTFMVGEMEYFARWLLMFTDSVSVIHSDRLRDKMEQLISQLNKIYVPVMGS